MGSVLLLSSTIMAGDIWVCLTIPRLKTSNEYSGVQEERRAQVTFYVPDLTGVQEVLQLLQSGECPNSANFYS